MYFTQIKKLVKPVEEKAIDLENGITFKLKQYLPMEAKYRIIKQSVDSAVADRTGIIDHVIADMMLHLSLVYEYTDISFTKDQQEKHFFEVYDALEVSGVLSAVVNGIPDSEYKMIVDLFERNLEELSKYHQSIASLMGKLGDLVEDIGESVKGLDMEKIQNGLEGIKPLLGLITKTQEIKEGIK